MASNNKDYIAKYSSFYINVDVTGPACPVGDVISLPLNEDGDNALDLERTKWFNPNKLDWFSFLKFTGSSLCSRKYKISSSDSSFIQSPLFSGTDSESVLDAQTDLTSRFYRCERDLFYFRRNKIEIITFYIYGYDDAIPPNFKFSPMFTFTIKCHYNSYNY